MLSSAQDTTTDKICNLLAMIIYESARKRLKRQMSRSVQTYVGHRGRVGSTSDCRTGAAKVSHQR